MSGYICAGEFTLGSGVATGFGATAASRELGAPVQDPAGAFAVDDISIGIAAAGVITVGVLSLDSPDV
jgi:hypothetical protein